MRSHGDDYMGILLTALSEDDNNASVAIKSDMFTHRLISLRGGDLGWYACCPDLSPFDFAVFFERKPKSFGV